MRAAIRTGLLGWTISFTENHPTPAPQAKDSTTALAPTDILIKVKSAAINPVDYKLPRAVAGKVIGIDVSGVVEKVGAGVKDFRVGDGVFGRAINSKGAISGSLADFAIVSMEEVAKKPEWLDFDQAAALPIAYLTGIQSLHAGDVKKGSSVLIIGASGGCGLAGVQLANAIGASRIVGICSGKNFEFVRGMSGIKEDKKLELVDYTDDGVMKNFTEENVGKFDCIYDTCSGSGKGEAYDASMPKLLKEEDGEYVQINGSPSTWARHAMGKMPSQRTMIVTDPRGKRNLEEIVALLKLSNVKPHLNEKSFDEEGVKDGFEQLRGRHNKGKIVFNMG
jgi:NADPH:quinone reductase-like Zn-dependent oxidoreductase